MVRICKKDSGFSLIEVAIALAVIGLLAVPYMELYKAYQTRLQGKQTQDNIAIVKSAMNKYAVRYGHYPTPADPNLAVGSGTDGLQSASVVPCTAASTVTCRTVATIGTPPNNGILIGAIPYADIGLPEKYAIDGYGNKLTYAVTQRMTPVTYGTTLPGFNNAEGLIKLVDRTNADVQGTTVNVHYLIVSHGLDGNGAFSPSGVQISACAPGTSKDSINCDNNSTFNNNYELINGVYDRRQYTVNNPTTEHYDDRLDYVTTLEQGLWAQRSSTTDIYMPPSNDSNVLVSQIPATDGGGNPIVPISRLEIRGDAGTGGNLRATELQTNRICDYSSPCDVWQPSCANEGGTCTVTSAGRMLYGPSLISTQVVIKAVTAGVVNCNNTTFTDPAPGLSKKCWIENSPNTAADLPPKTFAAKTIGGTPNPAKATTPGFGINCKGPISSATTEAEIMIGIADSDEQCYTTLPAAINIGNCPLGFVAKGINPSGQLICSIN